MKNTHCKTVVTSSTVFVLVLSLFLNACIDERYDLDRSISTALTFGGDSLTVPLGKTDTIILGDFLDPEDMDMLATMEDGGYALSVKDSISAEIQKIDRDALSIEEKTFTQKQTVDFGEISLEDFSIAGLSVDEKIDFNVNKISLGNFALPSVNETPSFEAGMSGYTLKDVEIGDINEGGTTGTVFSGLNLPSYGGIPSVPLPIEDESEVNVNHAQDINYAVNVPSGVTDISNVKLKDIPAATFTVSVELVGAEGVLTTGKIVPNLTINPSTLFTFSDLPDGVIKFESNDSMTVDNHFTISKTYHMDGLGIEGKPTNNILSVKKQVLTSGTVHMDNVYVLSDKVNDVKNMHIRVNVAVADMVIKSMDFNVQPVHSKISGSSELHIENSIPEDISKVSTVYFDEANHKLSFKLEANNMPSKINSELTLDSLIIRFPSEFKIKPTAGLSGSTFTLRNASFTDGYYKEFELESFDLKHLETSDNLLKWNSGISYTGQVSISFPNKINSANIPSSENNPTISMNVQSDLAFESADIITNTKPVTISPIDVPISFKIDIAEQIKRLDTIKLSPGTKARFKIVKPSLPLALAGNPLTIVFPPLFTFRNFLLNNIYSINVNDTIPDVIELELASLNINKDLMDGTLELNDVISIRGGVRLLSGAVNTKQVENLANESLQLNASTDKLTITSTSLKLSALSTSYSDSTTLDLPSIDLPEEIVSLDSILLSNGAKLDLDIDVTNMPRLDKPMIADIELDFPSLLGFAPGVADRNNKVVIHQAFVGGKLHKTINLKGLFFDGQELNGRLDIKEKVKYRVKVSVDETTVNSEDLTDNPIAVNVNVKLSGITFESVYGTLNPGIKPIEESISISGLPSFMKGDDVTLDITKPAITFETNCNLGIPIFVDLALKPSRNGVVMNDATQQVRIRIPKASSPLLPKTTRFWVAPDSAGMPQQYVFVQADIQKLFKKIPDDINITINASADKTEQHYINLLADYSMDVKYDVTVPFAFGEELSVQIKDTLSNLSPTIGESALSGKCLELLGTFQNSIPLELELELIPLDEDNIPLDVVPARQVISAGAKDGSATTSNLTIKLNDPNGELKKLRGFELVFKASSNSTVAGTPIRPDNFIIAELKTRLNGGITIGGKNN